MGTTVTAEMSARVSAKWSKSLDIGNALAAPETMVDAALYYVEQAAIKAGSIAASSTAVIDLVGSLKDPGGDSVDFTKIKGFIVKNTSTAGDGIILQGTFDTWLKGSGNGVGPIMPGGFFILHSQGAWEVTPTTGDQLELVNVDSSNAQTYEVLLLGDIN